MLLIWIRAVFNKLNIKFGNEARRQHTRNSMYKHTYTLTLTLHASPSTFFRFILLNYIYLYTSHFRCIYLNRIEYFLNANTYFNRFIWCSVDVGFGSVTCVGRDRRHNTANKATITEDAAAPAPIIIIVDCLCFSCFEISVGGSSDKMVSSVVCACAFVHVCGQWRVISKCKLAFV